MILILYVICLLVFIGYAIAALFYGYTLSANTLTILVFVALSADAVNRIVGILVGDS